MAREIRDAGGALIAWELSHTAQQVDDGVDAAGTAEQTTNRVTSVGASATDTTYPTAKAVWDLVSGNSGAGAEQTANRVTTLRASATNTTYPSAKAVWDLFSSITNSNETSY